jgi:hypothetical protein
VDNSMASQRPLREPVTRSSMIPDKPQYYPYIGLSRNASPREDEPPMFGPIQNRPNNNRGAERIEIRYQGVTMFLKLIVSTYNLTAFFDSFIAENNLVDKEYGRTLDCQGWARVLYDQSLVDNMTKPTWGISSNELTRMLMSADEPADQQMTTTAKNISAAHVPDMTELARMSTGVLDAINQMQTKLSQQQYTSFDTSGSGLKDSTEFLIYKRGVPLSATTMLGGRVSAASAAALMSAWYSSTETTTGLMDKLNRSYSAVTALLSCYQSGKTANQSLSAWAYLSSQNRKLPELVATVMSISDPNGPVSCAVNNLGTWQKIEGYGIDGMTRKGVIAFIETIGTDKLPPMDMETSQQVLKLRKIANM